MSDPLLELFEETSVLVASLVVCDDCGHESIGWSAPFVNPDTKWKCVKCGSRNTERLPANREPFRLMPLAEGDGE